MFKSRSIRRSFPTKESQNPTQQYYSGATLGFHTAVQQLSCALLEFLCVLPQKFPIQQTDEVAQDRESRRDSRPEWILRLLYREAIQSTRWRNLKITSSLSRRRAWTLGWVSWFLYIRQPLMMVSSIDEKRRSQQRETKKTYRWRWWDCTVSAYSLAFQRVRRVSVLAVCCGEWDVWLVSLLLERRESLLASINL